MSPVHIPWFFLETRHSQPTAEASQQRKYHSDYKYYLVLSLSLLTVPNPYILLPPNHSNTNAHSHPTDLGFVWHVGRQVIVWFMLPA